MVEGDPGASHWVRVALLYMPGYIMTTPSWVSSDSLAVLGCQPTPVCRGRKPLELPAQPNLYKPGPRV